MSAPFKWEEGADGGQPWLIIFRPGDWAAFRTLDFSFLFWTGMGVGTDFVFVTKGERA